MIKNILYPRGAVHPKYLNYVKWSFVSTVIISAETALSTHSMLSVVTSPSIQNELTVSINYIGKDILGELFGLGVMHKIGKKSDMEPKKFLKYATVCQQVCTIAECATPLLPTSVFIPVGATASVGKNIGFTGFGAVNARIIQTLAKENNIGEIYTKVCIFNTMGSSIGMMLGLVIASKIPDHTARLWLMPILGSLRIYSYNKAIDGLI